MSLLLISTFCALLSILASLLIYNNLRKNPNPLFKIAELADDIALGVRTYLHRQFTTICSSCLLLVSASDLLWVPGWHSRFSWE